MGTLKTKRSFAANSFQWQAPLCRVHPETDQSPVHCSTAGFTVLRATRDGVLLRGVSSEVKPCPTQTGVGVSVTVEILIRVILKSTGNLDCQMVGSGAVLRRAREGTAEHGSRRAAISPLPPPCCFPTDQPARAGELSPTLFVWKWLEPKSVPQLIYAASAASQFLLCFRSPHSREPTLSAWHLSYYCV